MKPDFTKYQSAGTLINFLSSRNVRNKFLLFLSSPLYDTLLQQFNQTKTEYKNSRNLGTQIQ